MGCTSCGKGSDSKPGGCNGSCSGGCNRLNTFDWLTTLDIQDPGAFNMVEVSFKNGSRKDFYKNHDYQKVITGDNVVVESGTGYDIGVVTLSGELVRLQMRKKKIKKDTIFGKVIRRANHRDMEKLSEARSKEKSTMKQARIIARTLGLEMKIGDVEFQGDKRKATFYYTAEGRIDFRELIRHFAKDFKVKIEMRQIGARQESARIGGIGSCGRELCCSTWLSEFKSVSTTAARYQNLAINQSKLSGQCGRLKCCLNYELDSYMDALEAFPKRSEKLELENVTATQIKTDIFKQIIYYIHPTRNGRNKIQALHISRVKEIIEMNKKGIKPPDLIDIASLVAEEKLDYDTVNDVVELPPEERRRRKKKKRKPRNSSSKNQSKGKKPNTNNKNTKSNDGGKPNSGPPKSKVDQTKKSGESPKKPGDKSTSKSSNKSNRRKWPKKKKGEKKSDMPNKDNKNNNNTKKD